MMLALRQMMLRQGGMMYLPTANVEGLRRIAPLRHDFVVPPPLSGEESTPYHQVVELPRTDKAETAREAAANVGFRGD